MRCCEHRPQTVFAPATDSFCTAHLFWSGEDVRTALRNRGFRVVPYDCGPGEGEARTMAARAALFKPVAQQSLVEIQTTVF